MPPPLFRRLLPLALLIHLGAGCAGITRPPAAAAPAAAEVRITNLTGYTWRVVVTSGGAAARVVEVGRFAVVDLRLPAGEHAFEQTLLDGPLGPAPARRFITRFAAGRSYRWSLATLLSTGGADPVAAPAP